MDISTKQEKWRQERPLFEAEFLHSYLLPFFNFNENTGDYEIKSEYENDEDRALSFNVLNTGWAMWLRAKRDAKAQAVPEGFVLVEKSKIHTWYQDDDEPENFCNSESDLNCLGDCLDDDDIIAVNIHESAHISTRKVFGVWKSNSPTDIQSNFVLVDSHEKAEEIVASNKAMLEAQEPTK
ncbi:MULTISPECIES: hypothetical protein [unclassified Acinetobacter]|uniref:hypothetical protein n=1 Tax=unclassified Acinetobacter TaxID=196816 RepID=UPI00211E72BC|nr:MULTISPECIES: hypothetical protein [unclassified Acinetobacter]